MGKIADALSGYKTYFLAAIGIAVTIVYGFGWLTIEQWQVIMGILGFGSAMTLRNAIY